MEHSCRCCRKISFNLKIALQLYRFNYNNTSSSIMATFAEAMMASFLLVVSTVQNLQQCRANTYQVEMPAQNALTQRMHPKWSTITFRDATADTYRRTYKHSIYVYVFIAFISLNFIIFFILFHKHHL